MWGLGRRGLVRGIGQGREAADWVCAPRDLGFTAPRGDVKESDPKRAASLPLSAGPARAWSYLSLTHSENPYV
jgi:hypothetical protein